MTQNIYFLRHAQTEQDFDTPTKHWHLSKKGKEQSLDFAVYEEIKDISIIYCSEERKTFETVHNFAIRNEIPVYKHAGLNEIHFSAGLPKSADDFIDLKKKCFHNLKFSEGIPESFSSGLSRFKNAISNIHNFHPNENVLVVSHGTVLTLYFGEKLGILNRGDLLYKKWLKLGYCAWGLEQRGKIIRDLL